MASGLRERLSATGSDLARLVDVVRRVIDATVAGEAPADALRRATGHVEAALAVLAPHVPSVRSARYPDEADLDDPAALMPYDPVIGPMSPLAPPVRVRWDPPRAIGDVVLGAAYEGPPGCVHGGVIAAIFDQVLNVANLMGGNAGPTARLALRYRQPTPLDVPLRFEGWQDRVEGKRIHAAGRLLAGDTVTVEAEGLFVVVPLERIRALLRDRPPARA